MNSAPRWIVAAFGVIYALAMIATTVFIPNHDDYAISLVRSVSFLRTGGCFVLAGACVQIVTGAFAVVLNDHHRDERNKPLEAGVIAALGTGVGALHALTGVFYAQHAHENGRMTYAWTSLVVALLACMIAFALLRVGRAIITAYVAIGVGLFHGLLTVLTFSVSKTSEVLERGAFGSLATALFALLVLMLGVTVANTVD